MVVVGVDGQDLGDPGEVGQVEFEEGVLELVAGGAVRDVAAVACGGGQIRAQHNVLGVLRGQEFVEESVVHGELALTKQAADVRHSSQRVVEAVAGGHLGGYGGGEDPG